MLEVRRIALDGIVIIVDGENSLEEFKELVQRATNLWPDASADIKKFADEVTNFEWHPKGALQDYREQDTSPKAIAAKRRKQNVN